MKDKIVKECESLNKKTNCFITIPKQLAGEKKFFVSMKDSICTNSIRTTAGSKMLEYYRPPFDATVASKIKDAGGSLIGKTSMDPFGFGSYGIHCFTGPVLNPLDTSRVAGGSSAGAAVSVAGLSFKNVAIAESTGGSISSPASFCGVVGFTPTYGAVSRYGLVDYANSLDKIGLMAKEVQHIVPIFDIIKGKDTSDHTSIEVKKRKTKDVKNIAIPKEYLEVIENEDIKLIFWRTIEKIESMGILCKEVNLPLTKYALPAYYIVATAEASTNLARFCGMRYGFQTEIEGKFNDHFSKIRESGFGKEEKRRIILGTFARMEGFRSRYYSKALSIRGMIINEMKSVFKNFDLILSPTMPFIAPKLKDVENISPLEEYMADVLTIPPNLAGMPHVSLPCGLHKSMPVGLHIIGDQLSDYNVLDFSKIIEEELKVKI